MSSVCAVILLSLSSLFAISIGSRSILPSLNNVDFALDLNATNFDALLKETPATYAVVEFFAGWCPACRNYKPQYEKVAKIFNGPDAAHPGIILMTRVDCALKINNNLCRMFSIEHYPTLLWGPPSTFVSSSKQEKSGINAIEGGQTAQYLLNWINGKMNSSYRLDDNKYENDHLHSNASDPKQIARAIYDIEEATYTTLDIILNHKMIKIETQAPLIKFFQLLVVHHPSRRCRKGAAEILVDFENFSAKTKEVVTEGVKSIHKDYLICGDDIPRGYWIFCRGSKNETRGFSCGLWVLLHSLSVRVGDEESHLAFTSVCDFIHNFFICEECRQHFYSMCSSVSDPFKTAREFVLWLWSAHNKVNERLMKEEVSQGAEDPKYPKIIWPSQQLCPSCYLITNPNDNVNGGINWNEDEVYKFLVNYYGTTLITLSKDTKHVQGTPVIQVEDIAHAVVVPIGAALAIAMASCVFGGLACYWRQQQKSRKYKHYHSLKSI